MCMSMSKTERWPLQRFTVKWKMADAENIVGRIFFKRSLFTPHVNTLNLVEDSWFGRMKWWIGEFFVVVRLFVYSFFVSWRWMKVDDQLTNVKCPGINYSRVQFTNSNSTSLNYMKRTLNSSCHANDSIRFLALIDFSVFVVTPTIYIEKCIYIVI